MFSIFQSKLNRNLILESLSFGTLFFVKELVLYLKSKQFQLQIDELLTLLLAIILLGILYYAAIVITNRSNKKSLNYLVKGVVCVCICLSGGVLVSYLIHRGLNFLNLWNLTLAWSLVTFYFLLSVLGIVFYQRYLLKIYQKLLLISSPLAITLIFSLIYTAYEQKSTNDQFAPHISKEKKLQDRIIFLVFDEWDPTILFDSKENNQFLPSTYKWRNQSFYANRAYPAGTDTIYSMTSLTLGKSVDQAIEDNGKIRVTFQGTDSSIIWEDAPNSLFTELSSMGAQIGCVGGMLTDYGRVFFPFVSKRSSIQTHSFWENFSEHFIRSFYLWKPQVEPKYGYRLAVRMSKFFHENDEKRLFDLIKSNKCDFIFGHFHGGHMPALEGSTFDKKGESSFLYISNLKIIDHLLNQMEELLKQEGLWDSTTIILTSDHWWRMHMWLKENFPLNPEEINQFSSKIDHRIPLIIKLKNQKNGFEYQNDTSTLFMKEIIYKIIDGSIDSSESLASFLDYKEKTAPSEIQKWENLRH